MTSEPVFDIRKPVRERILGYMLIVPTIGLALIGLGRWIVPDTFVWEFSIRAVESSNGWVFFGLVLIGTGIFNILQAIVLYLRSIKSSGEWHFRLTQDELLWKIPKHSFGPEIGFETNLLDIMEVEFRTITAFEQSDIYEYWIHFQNGEKIQLMNYTGYTLSWLVSEIHKAGVPYNETIMNR